ncbi:MAG TPA: SRPBCC domain-containing protein [Bacteroidales bacterium]|nr:SRPBCC domain-containing protein [Bacteroidales bacterium]
MNEQPVVLERVFNAPVSKVWRALTNPEEMKKWYFDIPGFRPEVGFRFSFYGGTEQKQYLHLCQITEVIAGKKISYSWKYDGYTGNSLVTFDLSDVEGKTRLKLTHSGLETFPAGIPDLAKENFIQGWNEIINSSLAEHVEPLRVINDD